MISEPACVSEARFCGPEQGKTCLELFKRRALDRSCAWQGRNILGKKPAQERSVADLSIAGFVT